MLLLNWLMNNKYFTRFWSRKNTGRTFRRRRSLITVACRTSTNYFYPRELLTSTRDTNHTVDNTPRPVKMGALKYVEELQKKKQSDMMRFLMRVRVRTVQLAFRELRLTFCSAGRYEPLFWRLRSPLMYSLNIAESASIASPT